MITLQINDSALEITKDNYEETLGSVENTFLTEAGTKVREITRIGIYSLSVSYQGTEEEKVLLDAAVMEDSLNVTVWDETTNGTVTHRMYMDPSSYKVSLLCEDADHRYYSFSFTLEEL